MDNLSIETFLSVAQERSFTRASEQLHLTQPAISKRIANLEQELDCQLFERFGKDIKLTDAGELFLEHAHKLRSAYSNCKTSLNNLKRSTQGKLNFGVSQHIGLHRLPPILKEYSRRYPRVHIQISFLDSEEAYEKVLHGDIEFALATLTEAKPNIKQKNIWHDSLSFCTASEHPLNLIAKNRLLTLKDLLDFQAILPSAETFTGKIITDNFAQQKLPLEQPIETNYLETIKMMTQIGLGWSVLPNTMIESLNCLEIEGITLSRSLGLLQHENRTQSNAAYSFIELLEKGI